MAAAMPRYRRGFDRSTRRPLVGFAHLEQSIAVIVTTLFEERVMRGDFGCAALTLVGQNMVPPVILAFYQAIVPAVHKWEPEYRFRRVQIVKAERTGTLGLGHSGIYFPEGRFGNYALREVVAGSFPLLMQKAVAA